MQTGDSQTTRPVDLPLDSADELPVASPVPVPAPTPVPADESAPDSTQATAAQEENSDNTLREKVQAEVVKIITRGLESGKINEERARSIAKMILEKLPEHITSQELMQVIPQLDDEFTELSDVVVPIMNEYEDRIRTIVSEKVGRLIQARKFKEALEVTRKALNYSQKMI